MCSLLYFVFVPHILAIESDSDSDFDEDINRRVDIDPGLLNAPSSFEMEDDFLVNELDDYDGSHDMEVVESNFIDTFENDAEFSFAGEAFHMNDNAWKTKHKYGTPVIVFDNCNQQQANIKRQETQRATGLTLPKMTPDLFYDPIFSVSNEKQREFLCSHLKHLEERDRHEHEVRKNEPLPLRQLLIGVAGTGKSFVMKCTRMFHRMLSGNQMAERSMAPTGKSAGGMTGVTVDRGLGFSRTKKEYTEMGLDKKKELLETLKKTDLIQIDEQGMIGAQMFGHIFGRCDELLNQKSNLVSPEDPNYVGGIPAMVLAVRRMIRLSLFLFFFVHSNVIF